MKDISENNIYGLLGNIQKRPGMWVKDGNKLSDITMILHGYEFALSMHNIEEKDVNFTQRDFTDWLHRKTKIGGALGWANILNTKYPDPDIAFQKFFEYVEEFRKAPAKQRRG